MPLHLPPRDGNGAVIPHNNECISDEQFVIRRITAHHIAPDKKAPSGRKISSNAIRSSTGENSGMSVDIKSGIEAANLDPETFINSTMPECIGAILINVGFLRSLGLQVGSDPMFAEPPNYPGNPYHGEIWGNMTRSIQKQILANAKWLVEVPDVDLHV